MDLAQGDRQREAEGRLPLEEGELPREGVPPSREAVVLQHLVVEQLLLEREVEQPEPVVARPVVRHRPGPRLLGEEAERLEAAPPAVAQSERRLRPAAAEAVPPTGRPRSSSWPSCSSWPATVQPG